jgi:hypothetical protein
MNREEVLPIRQTANTIVKVARIDVFPNIAQIYLLPKPAYNPEEYHRALPHMEQIA